jgi:tetratricopeptide (TPR) repeat protein
MKSERKQIQESNLLADKIEAQFVQVKKALPAILAISAIVLVSLLGYGLYASMQETAAAKAWTALYFSDTDPSELTSISSDFAGTSAGQWAKQKAGDAYMAKALERVYVDREVAEQYFKQAIDEYQAITNTSDVFLKERAWFGQAQAAEGLGDSEQAVACYRKVTATPGLSPELLASINQRINWIESKSGEAFFAWYQQRKSAVPALQQAEPVKLPLPGAPDFQFKDYLPSDKPIEPTGSTTAEPTATEPTATEPAAIATPAAEPALVPPPATEAPASEAPTTEPK